MVKNAWDVSDIDEKTPLRKMTVALNRSYRSFKQYTKQHKAWEKRMARINKTIQGHKDREDERLERKRLKALKKKPKLFKRMLTWISY